jgi:hypothetical protein
MTNADVYWIHGGRHDQNEDTRPVAARCGSPWEDHEIEILLMWDRTHSSLNLIAEMLERTREACQNMYYRLTREQRGHVTVTRTTVTTYHYGNWAAEDRSEWYA